MGFRRVAGLVVGGLFALGSIVAAPPPAGAAAPAPGLDGASPVTTGCVTGSYSIYSSDVRSPGGQPVGKMQVMYSPRCGTNWVRAWSPDREGSSQKTISRPRQGSLPAFTEKEFDSGYGWSYSMMVYAPGATKIKVTVFIDSGGAYWGSKSVTLV